MTEPTYAWNQQRRQMPGRSNITLCILNMNPAAKIPELKSQLVLITENTMTGASGADAPGSWPLEIYL
jgi:hypothetical protein